MEFVVVGLFVVAVAFVLPIYLLFSHKKLQEKVANLEARLAGEAPVTETVETAKAPWQPPEIKDISEAVAVEPTKEVYEPTPPKAFVFRADLVVKTTEWMQKNWFFAVAAVSMALAGIFLVQYGVENGLLSPALRVMGAIGLGVILIGAGEYIRRKLGDDEDGSFALLPSAFAGAGLVALFAGVLSARVMYDLIGSGTAFIGLGLTGAVAVILGWFYGPLLAIVGVLGALAAPFLVGGDSDSSQFLQFYFAVIAGVALTIDTFKRWAWLSVMGVISAYAASWLLYVANNSAVYFMAFALITMALAVIIPMRSLTPKHGGARVLTLEWLRKSKGENSVKRVHSEFPTRLASGAIIASSVFVGMAYVVDPSVFWLSLAGVLILLVATLIWMEGAKALRDMAYLPAAIGLGIMVFEAGGRGFVHQTWLDNALRPELDLASPVLAVLLIGALGISLVFAWRSSRNHDLRLVDAGVAALYAPVAAILAEVFWSPSNVLGTGNWALYLSVIAIAMTALAARFSGKDGPDRLRTAMFALSAISMLSFVLIVMLGSFALTLALAVMVATAAWMGAKFDLPLFDRYVQVGVLTVTWRLVFDPGVIWAYEGEVWQVMLAFVGAVSLLIVAYLVKRKAALSGVIVMLESSIWSLPAVFLTIMLARYFDHIGLDAEYLGFSLIGLVWLISCANQLYRIREGVGLRRTRITLASIYALLGGVMIVSSVVGLNPMNGFAARADIAGPYVLDSIFGAYALPGLLLAFVALRFTHLGRGLRKWMGYTAAALVAFYIGLEIRRWWHGDDIRLYHGTFDGELYSYTIAMMIVAVILLVLAFLRQSALLRKLALVMVALTVAKVYLIDMSGLDGLLRVVSFLVLGLVLAAMAWVNRILQNNEAKVEVSE